MASSSSGQFPESNEAIEFIVKNSSKPSIPDFKLAVTIDSTVGEVKAKIRQNYDGNPEPSSQTIIYAGKVLKGDALRVGEFINKNIEQGVPHSLHLVVRDLTPAPASGRPDLFPRPVTPEETALLEAARALVNGSLPATSTAGPGPASEPLGEGTPAAQFQSPTSEAMPPQQAYQFPQFPAPYQAQPFMMYNPSLNPALTAAYNAALASLAQSQQQDSSAGATSSSAPPAPVSGAQSQPGAGPTPEGPFMQYPAGVASQPLQLPHMQMFNPYAMGAQIGQQQQQQQGQQQLPGMAPFTVARFGPFLPMAPVPYGMYSYPPYVLPPNPYMMPQNPYPFVYAPPGNHPGGQLPQNRGFGGVGPVGGMHQGEHVGVGQVRQAGGRARQGQMRVRMVRVNLRAALQLAVLGLIVWQHTTPMRFLTLAVFGLAFYLTAMAPLQRLLQQLQTMLAPPRQAPGQPRARGFLRELQALLIGFFTSLLPGWNINPEDAAAFAAAQQAEEAAANRAAEAAVREHQD